MTEYIIKLEGLSNKVATSDVNQEMDTLTVELKQFENNLQNCHLCYGKWLEVFQEVTNPVEVQAKGGKVETEATAPKAPKLV